MSEKKVDGNKPDKTYLEVFELLTEYCGIGCEIPHKNICVVGEVKKCGKGDNCCCFRCVVIRDYFENKRVFVEGYK